MRIFDRIVPLQAIIHTVYKKNEHTFITIEIMHRNLSRDAKSRMTENS